MPHRSTEKT